MKIKARNNQLARMFNFFFFFYLFILTKDTEDKRNCKMVVEFEILTKSGLIKLAAENILIDDHMLFSFKNKYHYTYPNTYIALYNLHAKVTCNTHTHTPKNKKLLTIPLKLLPSLANYPPLLSPLPRGGSPPLTQN